MTQTTSTEAADPKRYKKTLNLPRTGFPMKANLVQNEPASVKRWEAMGLYKRIAKAREGAERFVFHDGPPYANAPIHLGHMLNKTLKDFVVRTHLMEGMSCPFVPGWDCHGLPIEHMVVGRLAEQGKLDRLASLDDDDRRMAIRRECHKHAEKWVKEQSVQMLRLLTLADYDDPYLTLHHSYEGAVLEVFARLVEERLVYRRLKAVHWSIANETALADAELEYQDREDISVYVDFEADDADAVYDAFGLTGDDRPGQRPCFMIWTTTPWTLPANLAIAVHEGFAYALVKMDGNYTVLAADLVERVAKNAGAEDVETIATAPGSALVGLRYRHPFVPGGPDFSGLPDAAMRDADPKGIYRVVEADYVTMEDGTGLVHTAPGHGSEDYLTGLKEKLPVYCPVREDGTYDDSVPESLRGVGVWEANESITKDLRESGHLVHDERFTHSYPHDWRSKTPVIFRATEQWFVSVDDPAEGVGRSLRQMALDETADRVEFIPAWGKNRMRGMLESRPDWCVSRQRSWGLPIPAFYAPDGSVLLTPASVRAIAKAFRERGSDSWFTSTPEDLLRHYDPAADPDAPKNLKIKALTKGHDIFDVWFESGSSWNAVMRERSGGGDAGTDYPVDLYLEGSDQHRGWFQLSLLPGLGVTGRSPFTSVLTHGFIVDKDGKKMSKSGGNALGVDELIKDFGADVCRWWIAQTPFENDIKADLEFFRTAGEGYRKVRNTLRFLLSNLDDFEASPPGKDRTSGEGMCVPMGDYPPTSLDAWALGELDRVQAEVREAYRTYRYQRAAQALFDFCNDTLSAVYLAATKDRLYCDPTSTVRRRRTQNTMWDLADALCRLLAPLLPHTADEAWRALHKLDAKDTTHSVHLLTFADPFRCEVDEAWPRVMTLRDEALQALEKERAGGALDNPLDAALVLPDREGFLDRFDRTDLADLLGVSRVETDPKADGVRVIDLRGEPRCERSWKRDGTVRERSDGGMLSDRDAAAVGVS
jgi:isoleucyl-tRNA synthetase